MQNISVSADAQSADVNWRTTVDFSSSTASSLPLFDFIGPQWKEH